MVDDAVELARLVIQTSQLSQGIDALEVYTNRICEKERK